MQQSYNNMYNPYSQPPMPQNVNNGYIYSQQAPTIPQASPNAVNINIVQPQAFATNPNGLNSLPQYSMYGANPNPQMPYYPMNYNNMVQNVPDRGMNAFADTMLKEKTPNPEETAPKETEKKDEKDKKDKKPITLLTDDYIKSLENYLDNDNPKIRLIGAKELMERFKEDEERKSNPCLTPLLNKALKDTSPSVRFLGLTALQLGYCTGDDETISILKEIQATNKDKFGEDAYLASEVLLKLAAPQKKEVVE